MDQIFTTFLADLPTLILIIIIAGTLFTLGKGADILVDQSVLISLYWGVPKIIIGATIISLGTTLPEASVSVLAAINGQAELALGNGVGSIIANTGLILGLAVLLGRVPIDKKLVGRQGLIMVCASFLIVLVSLPFLTRAPGGLVSRTSGIVFVILLLLYIYFSITWSKKGNSTNLPLADVQAIPQAVPVVATTVKFIVGITLIIVSSKILIQSVEITAIRIGIPQSVIAATLIAFGTSLPELIMAVNSVKKGHGELALGNVVGANILNVLFVIGTAAAVTPGGLVVPTAYYYLQFPTLLIMMMSFVLATKSNYHQISKKSGYILMGLYGIYIFLNYI